MTAELLAEIATAWREAFAGLRDGRPCDFCPAAAGHVRFLAVEREMAKEGLPAPPGHGAVGFYVLCGAHNGLSASQFERRALDLLRAELRGREVTTEPYWHPTVLGPKVGQAGAIPRRRSLESCAWCGAMMWVADNAREEILAYGAPRISSASPVPTPRPRDSGLRASRSPTSPGRPPGLKAYVIGRTLFGRRTVLSALSPSTRLLRAG
jgi:hypothetical protein